MGGQKPLLPEKEYFNIGEACRVLQVPAHTLRYWEQQFKLLRPTRRNSGHRRYTRRDMETAFQIKDLLQNKKMTAAGARKALAGRQRGGRLPGSPAGAGVPPGLVKLLRQVRDDVAKLSADLSA
jgi:DNA-binding transcriptional MerR regulator